MNTTPHDKENTSWHNVSMGHPLNPPKRSMKLKIIALAVIASLATQATAQERVELTQTGVGWVDKLGAMVQSIINMGADSVAENSQPVQPNTPTTTQESLTQVLKAMTSFSSKIGPQAPPPTAETTN